MNDELEPRSKRWTNLALNLREECKSYAPGKQREFETKRCERKCVSKFVRKIRFLKATLNVSSIVWLHLKG